MAHRSGWCRLVLVVVLMLVALPAMAGGRVSGEGVEEGGFGELYFHQKGVSKVGRDASPGHKCPG
jgi:hypothetical protein